MEPPESSIRRNSTGPRRHLEVLVVGALVLAVVAIACHPLHRHVDGVHSTSADRENWCVQMHTEQITDDTARQRLDEIIESNALGWESRDTIDFSSAGTIECSESVDRSIYEIEAHISDDVVDDGACPAGAQACVEWRDVASVHDEIEQDYDKLPVHFNAGDMVAGAKLRFAVNHEFGHVVGLADPTLEPDVVDYTAEHCLIWVKVEFLGKPFVPAPVASIMHDRRCPQVSPSSEVEWPTLFDFISFDDNVK